MNKQSILNRMLRSAANYLGVKRLELLDPVVILFIESLAEEVYKLSGEVDSIESRMLETLSDMLCSDVSLSAHPAHCILHAASDLSESVVLKEIPFLLRDRRLLPEGQKELSFHSVCKTKIRKGDIRYTIFNGLCYQIDSNQTPVLISRSRNSEFAQKNSYWIALDIDDAVGTLQDISFYFDFTGISNKSEYLRLLPFMVWTVNGQKINCRQGLYTIEDKRPDSVVDLFNDFDVAEKLDSSILKYYSKHFQTITDHIDISSAKRPFPQELIKFFPEHFAEDFTHPLVWIQIEYPPQFTASIIESMSVNINAFPIANKFLYNKTIEVNDVLQIIPLETDNHESLLSIHSVTDAQGREYYELPFDDTDEKRYRTYSLRRGGYERYNKRDVREYLINLMHILESHTSVKTVNDENMEDALAGVHGLVKHIKEIISRSKEKLEIQSYLLINELDEDDVFFIKYWTTNCLRANNIKQYTPLDCLSPYLSIDTSAVFTLTATLGGKYPPQSAERQNLRIKSLTDKRVLVTNKDIINFCKKEFGDMARKVQISNGLTTCPNNKQEFIRTTDVTLTLKNELGHLLNESEIEGFKQLLQKNSPATFNYRIYINNEN